MVFYRRVVLGFMLRLPKISGLSIIVYIDIKNTNMIILSNNILLYYAYSNKCRIRNLNCKYCTSPLFFFVLLSLKLLLQLTLFDTMLLKRIMYYIYGGAMSESKFINDKWHCLSVKMRLYNIFMMWPS